MIRGTTIAAVALVCMATAFPAAAMTAPNENKVAENSFVPFQEARWFCHAGPVFLHWGPCRRYVYYYPRYVYVHRPRWHLTYY